MATASVVTYARARAEAVGLHGEVGIAPRPERLVVLAVTLVVTGALGGAGYGWDGFSPHSPLEPFGGNVPLVLGLGIIVVTCAITIVQRIVHVQRQAAHR